MVAVTWFLFGREDWMIHSTAEECCFLVKEYGLSYAARIEVAFRSQRGPSGSRVAQLSEADRQSDADFANWAARAVRSLVSEA